MYKSEDLNNIKFHIRDSNSLIWMQ